jgi:hypothetical protein
MKLTKQLLVDAALSALQKSEVPVQTLCVESDWLPVVKELAASDLTQEEKRYLLGLDIQVLPNAGERCWLYTPDYEELYQEVIFEYPIIERIVALLKSGAVSVVACPDDFVWGQVVELLVETPAIRIELHELLSRVGNKVHITPDIHMQSRSGKLNICMYNAQTEVGKDTATLLARDFNMPVITKQLEININSKEKQLNYLKDRLKSYRSLWSQK